MVRWVASCSVPGWIRYAGFDEAIAAQAAGVAVSAGAAIGVGLVARHRHGEVDTQAQALVHDRGLAHVHERGVHTEPHTLVPGLGGKVGQGFEGIDERRPAIGVSRVVHRVDAAENVR